jgi:dTDP-4-amino-4,6-dideoxygalactose transaminase
MSLEVDAIRPATALRATQPVDLMAGGTRKPKAGKIPAFSLERQHRALAGELAAALDAVVRSGRFIQGPWVEAFEEQMTEFTGLNAVGVGSGTDALRLTLRALGIGPGDEVITTPFTFVATAEVIRDLGARPVFADVDPQTLNLLPEAVLAAISPRTRAILPVHLFGRQADMAALSQIARRNGLALVEDACQAVGSRHRSQHAGWSSHAACLSFYPTKNLGGLGDGGMVLTRDPALARQIRRLRSHGADAEQPYRHTELGACSRLDAVQAAVLSVKLRHLDAFNAARRGVATRYRTALGSLPAICIPPEAPPGEDVYHQYTVRSRDRDALRTYLDRQGIGAAVYYPTPLHLQPCFSDLGYAPGAFPEAERAAGEVLSLPMWPELLPEEVDRVAGAIRAFAERR